jgi:hypothetical protein
MTYFKGGNMSDKLDLKKENKQLYNPSKIEPSIVDIPEFKFLMIDGTGLLSTGYKNSIQVLFGVSYKIKFSVKKEKGIDYGVMPLEGLWWADDMADFEKGEKEKWLWTLMIRQPDFIKEGDVKKAVMEFKNKNDIKEIENLRYEKYCEGVSAQIMHIGPFSEEHENIMRIHELIKTNGGKFDGCVNKHHEIYLSDIRKSAPEKLKTILRQPFVKLVNGIE